MCPVQSVTYVSGRSKDPDNKKEASYHKSVLVRPRSWLLADYASLSPDDERVAFQRLTA